MVTPWRPIKGAEPDALKGASPVLNGGDEETGLVRPRLVATQRGCLLRPSGLTLDGVFCLDVHLTGGMPRQLTMDEIIFSLKHYWRFVDSEALELKALSQGVHEKAA